MLFFFLISVNSSYAIENIDLSKEPTVLFEADEITDLDAIIDRAKEEQNNSTFIKESGIITLSNGEQEEIPMLKTTQLLKIEHYSDGIIKKDYATSAIIEPDYITDQYREKYSLGVTAYSTIYYSIITQQGIDYYYLSHVTGGWVASYSSTVTNREVIISGNGHVSGGGSSNKKLTKYPTSNSFNYSCPSDWPPVAASMYSGPGVTTTATVSNGGSTATLTLINNLPSTI